ncbi:hypothetical protein [Shewanella sp. NIFS-20-20]|uniref:hypothetical protein n=1 Tax=Shewanella sp. NIFS-20-20 TaxID=2853806 RepID=UPI001C43C15B|nr:hypothetical protein [Shewanella sp. NIFS-20-20]MBV7314587.1 hypothetical protein [Shewanella sp. NIFS-20-20]
MSTLTKEEVISALQAKLEQQQQATVTIEQKGSWYKINGGKSIRFSEIEQMLMSCNDGEPAPAQKKPQLVTDNTPVSQSHGLTPKALWRQHLANQGHKNKRPRGC